MRVRLRAWAAGVALVAGISSQFWAGAVSSGAAEPTAPPSDDSGRTVYEANCAVCHGNDGTGNGRMGADFHVRPTDLTDPEYRDATDHELVRKMNHPMPSFRSMLSEQEKLSIAEYVRSLGAARIVHGSTSRRN
jgi:mono/diheme cytochrome c family protein